MQVTASLSLDDLKQDITDEFCNRLESLGYDKDKIETLLNSINSDIDWNYADVTLEVEMNDDETEVTGLYVTGG